jgi:hypothetical protein
VFSVFDAVADKREIVIGVIVFHGFSFGKTGNTPDTFQQTVKIRLAGCFY